MTSNNEKKSLFDQYKSAELQSIPYLLVPIILTLFFIQAFRAYVPGIYIAMFHVVFQDPGWVGALLTLLTLLIFFVPLFTNKLSKKIGQKNLYLIAVLSIAILRLIIAIKVPSLVETVLAALLVAFYGIFASIFLKRLVSNEMGLNLKAKVSLFSIAFVIAFLLDMTLRTLGFSSDISLITIHLDPASWYTLQYVWLVVQVPLSLMVIWFAMRSSSVLFPSEPSEPSEELRNEPWVLNAGGVGMVLFLLFNVLLYPSVIAEYTDLDTAFLNPIMIGAFILILLYLLFSSEILIFQFRSNFMLNILLLLAFALFFYMNSSISVFIILAIMFIDVDLFIVNMSTQRKKGNQIKQFSKLFSYGVLFLILMSFLHDFSTDHAFTIPAFQGLGPTILFIAGTILVVTAILASFQLKKYDERRWR
ncbi:MAG: hypothetical protein ACTSRS_15515 [Candidatus Helarchaeota archaeon]